MHEVNPYLYGGYILLTDASTLGYLFFIGTAALAVAVAPEFSCLNLLTVARRVPEMRYVLHVVRNNLNQLLKTLLFALLLIYIFALFAYSVPVLRDGEFDILGVTPRGLGPSMSLLNTLFYWDYGFREGPVFSWAFAQHNASARAEAEGADPADDSDALGLAVDDIAWGQVFVGFFFNFSYHIVIILVFSAVVSGIIIDSFAELRAKNNAIRADIVGTCFICNIEREDFEQLGISFKAHVKEEHNMWDYAFFRLYLEEKESIDYSGLETYCEELIRDDRTAWFPIKKAKAIIEGRNKEKKDLPGLYRRMRSLEGQLTESHGELRRLRLSQAEHVGHVKDLKDEIQALRRAVAQGGGAR